MPRVARLPCVYEDDPAAPDDAPEAIQDWDANFPGQVINLTRLVANEPRPLKAFTAFIREVYIESDLTPSEVELAYTTALVANQCHYWIPTHTVSGRSVHLTDEQLAHLGDDTFPEGIYSPREAATVRFSQALTRQPPAVSDEVYDEATLEGLAGTACPIPTPPHPSARSSGHR